MCDMTLTLYVNEKVPYWDYFKGYNFTLGALVVFSPAVYVGSKYGKTSIKS